MNHSNILDLSNLESDDFALTIFLQKIQNGEEVASEEFHHFINKGNEIIRMLQRKLLSIGFA